MAYEKRLNVGIRLRSFRERRGWSLRVLAERCGLSINAISRIERGENSPTVSSLHRLATALAVPITDFFFEQSRQSSMLLKKGFGKLVQHQGYQIEHLCTSVPGQLLEPFLFKIEADCVNPVEAISHPGEEFIYCLAGEIEYCVGDRVFRVQQGDSLLFESMQPHYWQNKSSLPALLLLVFQAAQDNSLARMVHHTG
jgi:transcriptional regulator with XRE-family HTH domain